MNSVLIESDWNLKTSWAKGNSDTAFSINRIRLEFKDFFDGRRMALVPVLIESDWNLKIIDFGS